MKLFVTFTTDTCEDPEAIAKEDFIRLPDDWADYVWQEAPDAETAKAQHEEKHDKWSASVIERGEPERAFY